MSSSKLVFGIPDIGYETDYSAYVILKNTEIFNDHNPAAGNPSLDFILDGMNLEISKKRVRFLICPVFLLSISNSLNVNSRKVSIPLLGAAGLGLKIGLIF